MRAEGAKAVASIFIEAPDDWGQGDWGHRREELRGPKRSGSAVPNLIAWNGFGPRFGFSFRSGMWREWTVAHMKY